MVYVTYYTHTNMLYMLNIARIQNMLYIYFLPLMNSSSCTQKYFNTFCAALDLRAGRPGMRLTYFTQVLLRNRGTCMCMWGVGLRLRLGQVRCVCGGVLPGRPVHRVCSWTGPEAYTSRDCSRMHGSDTTRRPLSSDCVASTYYV